MEGGGIKILSNLPTDRSRKVPTLGRGVSKYWKKKLPTSFMDGLLVNLVFQTLLLNILDISVTKMIVL